MDINERIRTLRESQKMSRRAFGEALGVSGDVINNIENNRLRRPEQKEPIYKLICKKFNVSEPWLRKGSGPMYIEFSKDEEISKFVGTVLSQEEESFKKRFIQMLSKLDESDWESLEKMVILMSK